MPTPTLDQILSCPSIPTPPAVAIKILELTRDPNVTIASLGKVVQNDPALSAKVLKTVNSSLFALPQKVTKIERALALMGLNAVKSLVLSFSLVDGTRMVKDGRGLDMGEYWRRSLCSASAARHLAVDLGACDPDEAFTGAIFQDLGMLACIVAITEAYAEVLGTAPGGHAELADHERKKLGLDHAAIGAGVAQRWQLPERYVHVIRHHHAPDAGPLAERDLTRVVAAGGTVAELLASRTPAVQMARLKGQVRQWFGKELPDLDAFLKRVTQGAGDLAKAFDKDIGARPNIAVILAEASERQVEQQLAAQREAHVLSQKNHALAEAALTDGLTGVRNRKGFDADLHRLAGQCHAGGAPFTLVMADADKFKSVNDRFGHPAGDAVLVELASRLKRTTGDRGVVCRYGGEEFAVLLPGVTRSAGAAIAEELRVALERAAIDLSRVAGAPALLPVTISLGVADLEPGPTVDASVHAMVTRADQALYRAKQAGRNRVSVADASANKPVGAPAPAADPGRSVRILLVDDDALAGKLVQLALQRRPGVEVVWSATAAEASAALRESVRGSGFHLVLADYNLGEGGCGLDVARAARELNLAKPLPVVVMSADPEVESPSKAAGASAFVAKRDLCFNLSKWVDRMVDEWALRAA